MSIQHLELSRAVDDDRSTLADDGDTSSAEVVSRVLWGSEPPYTDSTEDRAGLVSRLFYNWVYDIIDKAAAEKLSVQTLHPVQRQFRIWRLGSSFSWAMIRDVAQRDHWNGKIGARVSRQGDAASLGEIKWIGYAQRSSSPHTLVVGVEWSVLPRRVSNKKAAGEDCGLHDGTLHGEVLFTGLRDSCTLERPKDVQFVEQRTNSSRVIITPKSYPQAPSCWKTLFRNQWTALAMQLPPKVVADAFTLMSPVALEYFVKFLQRSDSTWEEGLLLVGAIFVINLVSSVANHKYYHISIRSGLVMRGALLGAIFEKVFTISGKALTLPEMSTGRIVNMVSGDVERVNDFNWYCCYMYSAPAQLIVSVGLLYRLVGWCAFAGVGAMVLLMPAQGLVVRYQHKVRNMLVKATDQRVKATNELFSGIRVVKYMGWEQRFVAAIDEKRRIEINHLRSVQLCRVLSSFINVATPTVVIATVFVLFHVSGHRLTPEIVFPAISLLGIMRMPFMMIPMLFTALVQFSVAMARITKFFECDNTVAQVTDIQKYFTKGSKEHAEAEKTDTWAAAVLDSVTAVAYLPRALAPVDGEAGRVTAIAQRLRSCCCCCKPGAVAEEKKPLLSPSPAAGASRSGAATPRQPKKQPGEEGEGAEKKDADNTTYVLDAKALLHEISLTIPRGKLTVVVGPTGSGKSTLLELLIGQFEVTSGRAYAEKSIAYVPQQPWIMNSTVEENITFFSDLNQELLQQAIQTCQLEADLATLASGLQTEIGEKGVNLSGGQRARVSLARAVYAQKELYLLDDPLSALDASVGEKILRECIMGGVLAGTTRVLATHHLYVIHHADHVIALEHGRVVFEGSPKAYEESMGSKSQSQSSPFSEAVQAASFTAESEEHKDDEDADDFVDDAKEAGKTVDASELQTKNVSSDGRSLEKGKEENAEVSPAVGQLMTVEEKAIGSVPWPTYMKYFHACGGTFTITLILSVYTVTEVFNVSSNVWLSVWSVQDFNLTQDQYLLAYIGMVSLGMFAAPLRAYFGYNSMRSGSLKLHDRLLRSVVCGTMSFFDTTPLGRILNRFAKDIDMADNDLQMSFLFLLQILFSVFSSLSVTIATQPFVLVPLMPCAYFYYRVLLFFNSANREVVRIGNVLKSPVFALLSESLGGVRTILAYNKGPVMMREAMTRLERVFATSYMQNVCNRWLGIRVEFVGNVIITSVALASVIGHMLHFGSRNVGMMALGLTLSMTITQTLNWVVRQVAAVESQMNSIERIIFYTESIAHEDLECARQASRPNVVSVASGDASDQAAPGITSFRSRRSTTPGIISKAPPGSISFTKVCLRYRDNLPLVLNELTFSITAGEKVGIVGRTGSGKSTLLMAFLRIVDICSGSITVGSKQIHEFSLDGLRKQFAMIPQDPLLFEGTVASNVDPFGECTEDELWNAMDLVGMKDRVASDAGGLDGTVLPGGTNFSVGQRQLLCMARALLKRDAAFILMDEATANIDPALDKLIQQTVRKAFEGRTVITIAHRLHTILAYDTILVMDRGRVVERGSPKELALNPDSNFRAMIASHGPQQERKLLKLVSSS
jgi:ABC-type multidrug transport system fused ATPase/permease subunit